MPRSRRAIDALPAHVRDNLSPETRRGLADMDVRHQRRRQAERAGTALVPDYLADAEQEAPGAARLYRALPAGASPSDVDEAARSVGLSAASAEAALAALVSRELAIRGPEGVTTVAPGGVPF